MSRKKILITGCRGQDASNLIKFLVDKDCIIIGTDRRSGNGEEFNWRHKELNIENKFIYEYMDITEFHNVCNIVEKYKPEEIYNLAAQSFVQTSFSQPYLTHNVNVIGHLNILEAVKKYSPKSKIYFACSSEIFGKVLETPQKETTPLNPRSPYGVSKLTGFYYTKNYREAYNLFACSGILFNHESCIRGEEFITRKLTKQIAEWMVGDREIIKIGNMDAKRDWGDSKDYVRAMYLMLQQDAPDDYVIATGETHSIREWIQECFNTIYIDIEFIGEGENEKVISKKTGKTIIESCKEFWRPCEVDLLIGDYTKAKTILGWAPTISFKQLVKDMMNKDIERIVG